MGNYNDIIHMPHHVSRKHPQMSMYMRASQFASFSVLSGHEDALDQTADKLIQDLCQQEDSQDDII